MKNKIKYLVAGFALILFVSIVASQQFPAPNEPRDCFKWGQTEGLYMCFIPDTGEYATWFSTYIEMHEYYTPQLKEVAWTIGNQGMKNQKTVKIGTLTVTGSPSYLYTHHK